MSAQKFFPHIISSSSKPLIILLLTFICYLPVAISQNGDNNVWSKLDENGMVVKGIRQIVPTKYNAVSLNVEKMKILLSAAPLEKDLAVHQSNTIVRLPLPDGSVQSYTIVESPVMEAGLAAQYPDIKTYTGRGVENPADFVKLDFTPKGFHAMIFSDKGIVFIDPYSSGSVTEYITYYKKDFLKNEADRVSCQVKEGLRFVPKTGNRTPDAGSCGIRHEYRLALSATGEYTAFHGGTVALALAAMVTTMNRVNGVFENDVAVRMILIANNSLIIYTNAATDPFTNGNPYVMIDQNQINTDAVIGSANYDIGHVFGTNSGGLAGLGVTCINTDKARGVTGSGAPIGDPFDIDYVAHEIGHQFGANHTFNNSCGGNRNNSTAVEPGSGSTIMAYAGICPADVQSNSDAYFSTVSIVEMQAVIAANACEAEIAVVNTSPTVNALLNYSIPVSTPFVLTATASDGTGSLSYCWEQTDVQIATMPPVATNIGGPAFRSLNPTVSPSRYFPNLAAILSNSTPTWEVLPSVARNMNFRVTVRDNFATAGCTSEANTTVTTVATAGPFLVTSPNTAVTYAGNSSQTITWDVAGTTSAPINCANVDILLTTDSGNSFTTLISGTANDGSQDVTIPNINTTTARVWIKCSNNIFFDVSNVNFTINAITCPVSPSITFGYTGTPYCVSNNGTQIPTFNGPVIDGILDASGRWGGPVALSDDLVGWPNDGPTNPFGNNVNVNDLYVTSDAQYVYFGATINSAANWQSWGFAINTVDGAGGSNEVWTFPIVYGHPQLPDFVIKGHFGRNDPGPYAELRKWSGSSWNQINNAGIASGLAAADFRSEETGMIEVRILKSILGNPSKVDVQFYISGDNQGEHGTFDAVPDDQVADTWNECCPFNVLDNYVNNIQVNGAFSAIPAGIAVNTATGAFTPSATTPNTYTITYTIPGSNGCPVQIASTLVTIESLPTVSVSVSENSGITNDGTICNGQSATLTAIGAAKNCLNFNGSNYIEAASTPTISLINALTVEAWVKTDNAGSTQYIVTKGTDDLSNGQYGMVIVGGKFQFHLFQSGHQTALSTTNVQSGVWYHVAGTWDGTTLKIYVNGVLENQNLYTGPMTSNNQALHIGNLGKPNFQYHFRGNIDEVRIWNTARSAAQILANYNKLVSSSPSLAAYYRLDEGTGSMTADMANANNATLFNSPAWLVSSAPIQYSLYSWSPAISLNTSNGQSVIATPSITTTYTVTVTSASGCVNTASTTISLDPLPCSWSAEPNGVGCNAGNSVAYNFNTQRFTVTSTNCYYPNSFTSDALAFAQYDLCGNGSITAQVTSITGTALGWAGITMRESNAPGAKKAQLMTNLSDLSRREFRTATNGQAYPQQFPSQNRYWLRITRTGNQFVMYISPNGTTWYTAGAQNISMNSCIEIGLIVTNYTPNSTVTATFANVSVTGGNITRPAINTQEDLFAVADFSIMPNPTNGLVEIDLSSYHQRKLQMELYNLQGKLLRSINIESVKGKEEVDLTSFANGMYLVRVRAEGLPDVTKRIVVNSNY